ncbi:hypothetical protein LJ737_04300 [Hymenobacter sp. 15J16-1T3B]|uniref:hypothetical protein n=1 Tax=Hymenobacter sp. 15J16-1T3B TaxID=2886941 RepID=UPI001D1057BD|nr:hypothetical protein [Hymenobacter sp. 15J16-1T3B]MCC3156444.1 hypothetical protein [Hymenobacter sp. 15J16-1T3B]
MTKVHKPAKPTAAPKPATPAVVVLRCEQLGVEREFTPDHAARLLKWQQERGQTDWQPVNAAESTD